jgi:UDP-N-acetylmuramate dehydrogenase
MINQTCKKDEPLSNHCTFRIGGTADFFCAVKSTDELLEYIEDAKAQKLPYFVFGGGSNILFSDKGFRGLVIKIETKKLTADDDKVTADAGVTIPELLKFASEHELNGLEKWIGLPGTIGGAVRGNAGCNGLETADILEKCRVLDPKTECIKVLKTKDLNYAYRESCLKHSDQIVLQATFKLKPGEISPEHRAEVLDQIKQRRYDTQPPGFSSGSFFKNPSSEKPAGMLIDQAGLKGTQIGKAKISEKHGNFIQNLGGATSSDILALAKLIKKEVKDKFNINLEEEVQILDEYGKTKS